jgi:hypothetical protein
MGLELVGLTLRIEETFAIQIPDDVAYRLTTPRQVTDYILTQVGESQFRLPCLSQRAFHLLRQNFLRHLSLQRHQFKPNTALKEIVPAEAGNDIWTAIGLSAGVQNWPTMSRPKWLVFIPSTVKTVRDLVEHVVTNEPLVVKGEEAEWTRSQVWEVLRRVIIDETVVVDFSEDSRFVQDMGLD